MEPAFGTVLSSPSVCQPQPARFMPSALPPSSTFETTKISGWPGRLYCNGSMMCSGPKRAVKAMCSCGVMRRSRNTRMGWRTQAASTSRKVASSTGRRRPSTSAANCPCSGRTSIRIILAMPADARLTKITDRLTPELVALRKQLHQHPELAFEEHETAKAVIAFLGKHKISVRTGIGKTGVIAVVEGAKPGPTIGIRADMDALPIHEQTGLPFASKVPGKMHACGHDVHTVIALGVAASLAEMRDSLRGKVKFIFQPAEETLSGARAMIADGAHPHLAVDALTAGAYFVSQLQTIVSREVKPLSPAVVTVGEFHAGTARNIIAGTAQLKGIVRTMEAGLSEKIEAAMRRMLEGMKVGMRVDYELQWQRMAP